MGRTRPRRSADQAFRDQTDRIIGSETPTLEQVEAQERAVSKGLGAAIVSTLLAEHRTADAWWADR